MSLKSNIRQVASEVQARLDERYKEQDPLPEESALNQCGLRDGSSVVEEYLVHGEARLAFEHLLYMIKEPGIALSTDTFEAMREAGEKLQLGLGRLSGIQCE